MEWIDLSIPNSFFGHTTELFSRHMSLVHHLRLPEVPNSMPSVDGLHNTVSMCYEFGQPTFCFRNIEDMIQSLLLSTGPDQECVEKMLTEQKNPENFVDETCDSPEKLLKILEVSAFDYRKHLLPLLSLFKWEQVKDPHNSGWSFSEGLQISYGRSPGSQGEVKKTYSASFDLLSGVDWTSSEYEPVQQEQLNRNYAPSFDLLGLNDLNLASVGNLENTNIIQQLDRNYAPSFDLLGLNDFDMASVGNLDNSNIIQQLKKEVGQISTSKASGGKHSQAFLYSISRRPEKRKPTPPDNSKDWKKPYDPYEFEFAHKQYLKELEKHAPEHLCSFCFFEKNLTIKVPPLTHYSQKHGMYGLKCNDCSARFTTRSALKSHRKFCHGVDEEDPGG